jgi:hypothetical protein
MLEGPRWATKRLLEQIPTSASSGYPASASSGAQKLEESNDAETVKENTSTRPHVGARKLEESKGDDTLKEVMSTRPEEIVSARPEQKLLENSDDIAATDDSTDELATVADASSKLLVASELCDEPPLLRHSAIPQLPFTTFSQRKAGESPRGVLKDSMRAPKEFDSVLMYSMQTPRDTGRSIANESNSRRSWEIGSDISTGRPKVPMLDLSMVVQLRQERLWHQWVPETPTELIAMTPSMFPQQSPPRTQHVCIDSSGCSIGFVDCKMMTPGGLMSKASHKVHQVCDKRFHEVQRA